MFNTTSQSISPSALCAALASGNPLEILDVRTRPEYVSAHVPGAKLIPLNELDVPAFLAQHTSGRPIYVLCQSGARAGKAIGQFEQAGCNDCVLVDGGMQAWMDAALPIHRGAPAVLPLMRQVQVVVGSLAAAGSILAFAVSRWFAILPVLLGCGLVFAGLTGTCGMALLLARMPWNQGQDGCSHCCNQE